MTEPSDKDIDYDFGPPISKDFCIVFEGGPKDGNQIFGDVSDHEHEGFSEAQMFWITTKGGKEGASFWCTPEGYRKIMSKMLYAMTMEQ